MPLSVLVVFTLLLLHAPSWVTAFESEVMPAVKLVPGVTILPLSSISSPTTLHNAHGWKNCDGVNGTVYAYRVDGCTPDQLCEIPAELDVECELDAVPSKSIRQLGMRLGVVRNDNEREGPLKFIEGPVQNSSVEGGTLYRIFVKGKLTQEYKGQVVHLQYSYYDVDSGVDEFCAHAYFRAL